MIFDETVQPTVEELCATETPSASILPPPPVAIVPAIALALSACGEGGTAASTSATPSAAPPPSPAPASPPPSTPITSASAGRFLAQASMGAAPADISSVKSLGFDGWLGDQFNKPRASSFYDDLLARGIQNTPSNNGTESGFDQVVWKQLIAGNDQLRQRVGTALLSILVMGIGGTSTPFRQFAVGAYMDILWDNAFGNFRTILDKISTCPAMGAYLTFVGNRKATAAGAQPDENYARELMQLFSIGLYQLNLDGTQKLSGGKPIETYTQADVSGLARVFTGWDFDSYDSTKPDYVRRPMLQVPARHELGAKTFLGTTIPANTDGVASLKTTLDLVFAHANVAPFISKQLIQHLVTSNPTPAYVQRIATVFENNGSGVRGDLRAVIRAILLDTEARDDSAAAASTTFGKLREPVMRFTAWARAYNLTSPSDKWPISDTSSTIYSLGQTVGRSPSVFNFFRPGYTPPSTSIASANLVAPEFQITNEPSVVAYVNFMFSALEWDSADLKIDYTTLLAKAADSQALLDDVNLNLAANQVSAATIAQYKPAIDSYGSTAADMKRRVMAAIILIMASPEFITLK